MVLVLSGYAHLRLVAELCIAWVQQGARHKGLVFIPLIIHRCVLNASYIKQIRVSSPIPFKSQLHLLLKLHRRSGAAQASGL